MTSGKVIGKIHDYDRPPVVETVLGVQFDRLKACKNAHLGAYWGTLDKTLWPTVHEVAPMRPQFERFGEGANWGKALSFQFTHDTSLRLQIRNANNDRMIQLQNDRFHFNWLRTKPELAYPSYDNVRLQFDQEFARFNDFAASVGLDNIVPNQWEVTYVNHIPRGTVWSTPADWDFFKLLDKPTSIPNLLQEESFNGEWHFVIPPQQGRLHIRWEHQLLKETNQEQIRLTLTARGPFSESVPDVDSGLNLGRMTIVRAFCNLTSSEANQYWGLKNADG